MERSRTLREQNGQRFISSLLNKVNNAFSYLVELCSEVSHLIPEPIKFAEVTILTADVKKYCLKENLIDFKKLINNRNFLMDDQQKGDLVTPCMNVYKTNIQYTGIIDKLKLIILVRGDLLFM